MHITDLQKTAEEYSEFPYPLKGNFKLQDFKRYYDFRILKPSASLAPFIAYYSIFEPKLPEGYELKFTQVLQAPAASLMFSRKTSKVFGVTTKRIEHRAFSGDIKIRVIFRPAGLHAFRPKGSMAELVDRSIPAAKLFSGADAHFVDTLLSAKHDSEVVNKVETLLEAQHPKSDENIEIVNTILKALDTDGSLTTVGMVAKKYGRSERWLQHLFYAYVGVGIKWVMMRSRILEAIRHTNGQHEIPWSQIAADLGYSTQSHLINDFKGLVGQSPVEFTLSMRKTYNAPNLDRMVL